MELCISPSHTIPANSGVTYNYAATAISGYKPIGVVGFQNTRGGVTAITAAYVDVSAQTIFTYTRNLTSTTYSDVYDAIRVLYIRDGFTV